MEAFYNSKLFELLIAMACSLLASSGFWLFVQRKNEIHSSQTKLLMGLAHDRIVYLGMSYLRKGCITKDEYEDLVEYLYHPYYAMGGNGTAKRIMAEIEKLALVQAEKRKEESKNVEQDV